MSFRSIHFMNHFLRINSSIFTKLTKIENLLLVCFVDVSFWFSIFRFKVWMQSELIKSSASTLLILRLYVVHPLRILAIIMVTLTLRQRFWRAPLLFFTPMHWIFQPNKCASAFRSSFTTFTCVIIRINSLSQGHYGYVHRFQHLSFLLLLSLEFPVFTDCYPITPNLKALLIRVNYWRSGFISHCSDHSFVLFCCPWFQCRNTFIKVCYCKVMTKVDF